MGIPQAQNCFLLKGILDVEEIYLQIYRSSENPLPPYDELFVFYLLSPVKHDFIIP